MTLYPQKLTHITALSTAIFLSACGGGGGSSNSATPDTKPQPFQSSFNSSLVIKQDGQPDQKITSRTTTENDQVNAYNFETSINSASLTPADLKSTSLTYSQNLVFQLSSVPDQKTLNVSYDPIHKRFDDIVYTETTSSSTTYYRCFYNDTFGSKCENTQLTVDAATGKTELSFSNSMIKSSNSDKSITLSGKITASISAPPQQLKDIPKTTLDNLSISGQSSPVLAAISKTYLSTFYVTELLFADGKNLLVSHPNDIIGQSMLTQPNASNWFDSKLFSLNDPLQLKVQSTNNNTSIQFIQAAYTNSELNNQNQFSIDEKAIINGSVKVQKPTQNIEISSWSSKQDKSSNYVPSRINITLINHNEKILSDGNLSVHLRDNKVMSAQLFYLSRNGEVLDLVDYACGITTSCSGIRVESNGFEVQFNSSILHQTISPTGHINPDMNQSITLNGGLVYSGR